ncbi:MAG: hypothetical protein H0U10_10060, partial [Chloroflexia bacterium]|nr:hypothetical protein [Chloroflexia bacterium]
GEQHGEALRGRIADGLGRWAEAIAATHGSDPDAYIAGFVRGTDYLPAIRRWTPDLLAEVAGIARGAGQPWEWIYASNLLDEEWTWAKERPAGAAPGCTTAGFAAPGEMPVLAQTMDIPNVHDGTQALLRVQGGDGPDCLVFTHAGMIGLTGGNAAGVAVVVNNLDVLPTSPAGLPVAFAVRGILERRTLADAVAFVAGIPHATGQHYGLAGPDGLASIEGWAAGVIVRAEPTPRLLHTNHPLYTEEAVGDAEPRYRRSRTRERLDYLVREAGAAGQERDGAGVRALLQDSTVPVSLGAEEPSMTFGAVVYECAVPTAMWVAPGPPHETAYQQVRW